MGRPERPLNPDESPLALLAADLRAAREAAGNPTYRTMARVAHRSRTTLSEAAGGRAVPTWETVQAFLRACDVPVTEGWRERWERCGSSQAEPEPDEPAAAPPRWRTPLLVASGTAIAGSVVALVVFVAGSGGAPESTPTVRTIANGAGPEDSGCANDPEASTVDAREVDLNEVPAGVVELRYSPSCGVSWPQFTPADPATPPSPNPARSRRTCPWSPLTTSPRASPSATWGSRSSATSSTAPATACGPRCT